MIVVSKDGMRYSASNLTWGVKEWNTDQTPGVWFWCTSAMLFVAASNIATIEWPKG